MQSTLNRWRGFSFGTQNVIKKEVEITDQVNWGDKGLSNQALLAVAQSAFNRRQIYVRNAVEQFKAATIFRDSQAPAFDLQREATSNSSEEVE